MPGEADEPTFDDLVLQPFTTDSLSAAAYEWQQLAGDDEFQVELSSVFAWAAAHLVSLPGDGHAIQVFSTSTNRTQAILEMVDGNRRNTTISKLLKIWVSPEFWPADRNDVARQRFINLYAGILVHSIGKAISADLGEIRIYARTDALLTLLTGLAEQWGSIGTRWSATMQGRWFVLLKQGL